RPPPSGEPPPFAAQDIEQAVLRNVRRRSSAARDGGWQARLVRAPSPNWSRKSGRAGVAVAVERHDAEDEVVLRDAGEREARDVADVARVLPERRAYLAPDDAVAGEVRLVVRAPTQRGVVLELH